MGMANLAARARALVLADEGAGEGVTAPVPDAGPNMAQVKSTAADSMPTFAPVRM
jgi:hypothetical protein